MASTSAFVSCKDYDDDIQNLQTQIDTNSKAISEIQKLIQSGSVITSVDKTAGGVTVKLSNGNSFDITNGVNGNDGANGKDGVDGANGKDGSVITIGDNGNWFIDGKDTGMAAQGPQGPQGEQGPQGPQGDPGVPGADGEDAIITAHVWVLSDDLLELIEYKDGVATGKKVSIETLISNGNNQQPQIVVSAVKTNDTLVLYGVSGSATPISISLSGNLRSLVFIPKLYLDGIETIEYPWLQDTILRKDNVATTTLALTANYRLAGKKIIFTKCESGCPANGIDGSNYLPDGGGNSLALDPATGMTTLYSGQAATDNKNHLGIYGPRIPVEYHLNPANSKTEWSSDIKFNVLEPDVVYYNTRAAASALNVTSPEKYADGTALFNPNNGILTAGLQVQRPELLNARPTDLTVNEKDNTIALQVPTIADNNEKSIVTSDYALLLPTKNYIDGLVWTVQPDYAEAVTPGRLGDEDGDACGQKVHVWDNPIEALNDRDGAALELPYFDASGITLVNKLGIHVVSEDLKTRTQSVKVMTPAQMRQWGLKFEFNVVDYQIDGNVTRDGHYVKWINKEKGQLRAWNVKWDGTHADGESATSIDRMPLVQVLVKDEADNVLLDGYVLIHISKVADLNEMVDDYPAQGVYTWDLCGDMPVFVTDWSMFNDFFLTQGMDNMTKEYFDAHYTPDLLNDPSRPDLTDGDGNIGKALNVYKDTVLRGDQTAPASQLGYVYFYNNGAGATNHRFTWYLTEEEIEQLTHHENANKEITLTRYIRFNRTNNEAKYGYIYVKMTTTIKRQPMPSVKFSVKNDNYWYDAVTGADNGWSAVVFDVKEPTDGGSIAQFNRTINNTMKVYNGKSQPAIDAVGGAQGYKYYFVPKKEVVITTQSGATYTITAVNPTPTTGTGSKMLYDKYIPTNAHEYDTDDAKLNQILTTCAIDWNAGAFTNIDLWAKNNATNVYTKIATLVQNTGEIRLINNDVTCEILNAVGYKANHANIAEEMRTFVGCVANYSCGLAKIVEDRDFLVSWQRPINLDPIEDVIKVDATTNGVKINIIDLIQKKFYDWRGPVAGKMYDENQWFWAYYNINAVTVDVTRNKVLTNMHNNATAEKDYEKLSTISTAAELGVLYAGASHVNEAYKYNFNLRTNYNAADKNNALLTYMAGNKDVFGVITYYNNGENVTKFTVIIPITIHYEWGQFDTTLKLTIDRSLGN